MSLPNDPMSKKLKEAVRMELGDQAPKACAWWKAMKPHVKKFSDDPDAIQDETKRIIKTWEFMSSLLKITNGESIDWTKLPPQVTVEKTYRHVLALYHDGYIAEKDIPDKSQEEMIADIVSCIKKFDLQNFTETIHKENVPLLKGSLADIQGFMPDGSAIIDSSKASNFISEAITINTDSTLVWVTTAEDGISRILQEQGRAQIILNMSDPNVDEEIKRTIFLKGIYDVATGKHFMMSAPSASATRHGDFPFVEASTPEEVFEIWCETTGFTNMNDLLEGLGGELVSVND